MTRPRILPGIVPTARIWTGLGPSDHITPLAEPSNLSRGQPGRLRISRCGPVLETWANRGGLGPRNGSPPCTGVWRAPVFVLTRGFCARSVPSDTGVALGIRHMRRIPFPDPAPPSDGAGDIDVFRIVELTHSAPDRPIQRCTPDIPEAKQRAIQPDGGRHVRDGLEVGRGCIQGGEPHPAVEQQLGVLRFRRLAALLSAVAHLPDSSDGPRVGPTVIDVLGSRESERLAVRLSSAESIACVWVAQGSVEIRFERTRVSSGTFLRVLGLRLGAAGPDQRIQSA